MSVKMRLLVVVSGMPLALAFLAAAFVPQPIASPLLALILVSGFVLTLAIIVYLVIASRPTVRVSQTRLLELPDGSRSASAGDSGPSLSGPAATAAAASGLGADTREEAW